MWAGFGHSDSAARRLITAGARAGPPLGCRAGAANPQPSPPPPLCRCRALFPTSLCRCPTPCRSGCQPGRRGASGGASRDTGRRGCRRTRRRSHRRTQCPQRPALAARGHRAVHGGVQPAVLPGHRGPQCGGTGPTRPAPAAQVPWARGAVGVGMTWTLCAPVFPVLTLLLALPRCRSLPPLAIAACRLHPEAVALLLRAGARPPSTVGDSNGELGCCRWLCLVSKTDARGDAQRSGGLPQAAPPGKHVMASQPPRHCATATAQLAFPLTARLPPSHLQAPCRCWPTGSAGCPTAATTPPRCPSCSSC